MMEGQIMCLKCPDCSATFYLFGDFINDEGQIVRAGDTHIRECERCWNLAKEVGFDEEYD